MTEVPFIEETGELEQLARKLSREKVIAVDTEADSFFHYHDKLCLMQISARCGTYLVDPLALPADGLAPLAEVFANPEIRKVLHAAEYDLYVLQRHSGIRIANLFDTMISAQLLGYPAVGLGALVERHFDVKLSKDQQRTDWSRRPLRPVQTEYAAADVLYLVELSRLVEKELRAKKRLEWAREEFASLEARSWPEREFDELGYLRIKGAKKLSARELAVLRELFLMRDRRARQIDRPPFKVLGNGTLLELALNPARSRRTLAKRKGITDLVVRRMGNELIEAIERGQEGPEHPPLEKKPSHGNGRKRLDRHGERRLDQLKRWRAQRASDLEMDPGVFCPNAGLEAIAWANPSQPVELAKIGPVKGWWAREFGAEAIEAMARVDDGPGPGSPPQDTSSRSGRKRPRRRRGRRGGSATSASAKS
jgi:ribonuclease D